MRAATCALAWGVAGVQDHKANTSLTDLSLWNNNVGDAGATALADALQATVLTCKECVFRASIRCHSKCRFTKSSEELASSPCSAVCVAAFLILLGVEGKSLLMSVSKELRTVVFKLMWHGVTTELD